MVEAVLTVLTTVVIIVAGGNAAEAASWCVARSDASDQALQTALDYACGAGADCTPLQSSGLCYLPNTIQAHASYAFNSYYQRKAMAPGSCDFAGTATVAKTDPSFGSCVYPSSLSTAGGSATPSTTPTAPGITNPNAPTTTTQSPVFGSGGTGTGGLNPGFGPAVPTTDNSKAPSVFSVTTTITRVCFLLVLSVIYAS